MTDAEQRDAMLYSICRECGSPRKVQWTERIKLSTSGVPVVERSAGIVCPHGHPQ